MPETIRKAFAIPIHVASQQAMAKEKNISIAMTNMKKRIAKEVAVRKRTTLSITSSLTYSDCSPR